MTPLIKDHIFQPSDHNVITCKSCNRDLASHYRSGTCEVCGTEDNVTLVYGNMYMCHSCHDTELKAYEANMTPEKQESRVNEMNAALELSRRIDEGIQVRTDIFNAKTVAIIELQSIIDNDPTIENKPYKLAEMLTERFKHLKDVVFELNDKLIDAGNEQKAIQIYLNQLSNKLRIEEREKLKIADINYKPNPPKLAKVKTISQKSIVKKLDKVELSKYATELGISAFTLQSIVIAKGITVEAAANLLRRSINEAKSESN